MSIDVEDFNFMEMPVGSLLNKDAVKANSIHVEPDAPSKDGMLKTSLPKNKGLTFKALSPAVVMSQDSFNQKYGNVVERVLGPSKAQEVPTAPTPSLPIVVPSKGIVTLSGTIPDSIDPTTTYFVNEGSALPADDDKKVGGEIRPEVAVPATTKAALDSELNGSNTSYFPYGSAKDEQTVQEAFDPDSLPPPAPPKPKAPTVVLPPVQSLDTELNGSNTAYFPYGSAKERPDPALLEGAMQKSYENVKDLSTSGAADDVIRQAAQQHDTRSEAAVIRKNINELRASNEFTGQITKDVGKKGLDLADIQGKVSPEQYAKIATEVSESSIAGRQAAEVKAARNAPEAKERQQKRNISKLDALTPVLKESSSKGVQRDAAILEATSGFLKEDPTLSPNAALEKAITDQVTKENKQAERIDEGSLAGEPNTTPTKTPPPATPEQQAAKEAATKEQIRQTGVRIINQYSLEDTPDPVKPIVPPPAQRKPQQNKPIDGEYSESVPAPKETKALSGETDLNTIPSNTEMRGVEVSIEKRVDISEDRITRIEDRLNRWEANS